MGEHEAVLAVYRHHWFAYASILFIAILVVAILFGLTYVLITQGGSDSMFSQYKTNVLMGVIFLSVLVMLFSLIPLWMRSQEKLILTDEALYQTLQPSLFSSKVSQLNLAHLADVTAQHDFFGTIFGFGHVTIETPGEQDNYEFFTLPNARAAVKEIIEAHENFQAALESGRLPTTFRGTPAITANMPQAPISIDPQEYRQFLAFQQMQREAAQAASARPTSLGASQQPTAPQTPTPDQAEHQAQKWQQD